MGTESGVYDVEGVMEGQREFEDWAGAHWGVFVRTGVFLGCGVHEAQDLAQATLEKCWSHWPRVRRADDRDAYVYRVLVNAFRDSRRRRSSTEVPRETLPEGAGPDESDARALAASVHQALAGLTRDHREVVVLRYFVDLSERQAAEVLRIAPGTVKSRLSRALAQLALDPDLADLRGETR